MRRAVTQAVSQSSRERILTTHVGSLPRKQVVVDVLFAQDRDEPTPSFDRVMDAAVLEIVARQKTAGVDVPSDGEMGYNFVTVSSDARLLATAAKQVLNAIRNDTGQAKSGY